jgi:AraC-like DNA-binding protein
MDATTERTTTTARTREPLDAAALLERHLATSGLHVEPRDEPFAFEYRRTGTALLALESIGCTGSVSGVVDPDGQTMLAWLKTGRGTIDDDELQLGRPKLYRPGPQDVDWTAFQQDAIRIASDVVEVVAAERGGWEPGPIEFQPHHVPDGAPLAAWWAMVRVVAPEVLGRTGTVDREREHDLARFAAAGLLTAIPHWPTGSAHERRARTRLARAERFLVEHAHESIRVGEVAAAAGLSVRGVQNAFERAHGVPPMTYLRGIRLGLARQRIEAATGESIAEVARAVGMPHLSRFASAYRAEFGRLPSEDARSAGQPVSTTGDGDGSLDASR